MRGEEVDERADLYAVGVIFYRLLAGRLPFDADTTVAMLQKHIAEPPTALHAHRTDLPPWCESIAQRALAKRPAERFQTASEFRMALSRAAGAAPSASRVEYARGADAEYTPATAQARKTTMVLSRKAAKVIRKSVRSATAARGFAVVTSAVADGRRDDRARGKPRSPRSCYGAPDRRRHVSIGQPRSPRPAALTPPAALARESRSCRQPLQ